MSATSYFACLTAIAILAAATPKGEAQEIPQSVEMRFILNYHNEFRKKHDAPPLKWSGKLEAQAQSWANGCKYDSTGFIHSVERGAFRSYGENFDAGWGEPKNLYNSQPSQVVQHWYDEVASYDYNNPGFRNSTGHFTQVVWKSTKEIGCGHAKCVVPVDFKSGPIKTFDYWVCQYYPPGNVAGQFAENVAPPLSCWCRCTFLYGCRNTCNQQPC